MNTEMWFERDKRGGGLAFQLMEVGDIGLRFHFRYYYIKNGTFSVMCSNSLFLH